MSLIVLLRNVTIQELLFPFGIQMVFSAEIAAHKAVKIAKQGIKCPVDFLFFTERLLTDIHAVPSHLTVQHARKLRPFLCNHILMNFI